MEAGGGAGPGAAVADARLRLGTATLYIVDVTPTVFNMPFIGAHVVDPGEGRLLVIDPGPGCCLSKLLELLSELSAAERGVDVYLTHIHLDHGGGAWRLVAEYPGARVYVHPRGLRHLADPSRLWEASRDVLGELAMVYGEPRPIPREALVETRDGMTLDYPGLRVQILHTPGHASHHQSILLEATGWGGVLFTGDSAGMAPPSVDAVVPTTPPPFKPGLYLKSLERQAVLKPRLLALPHMGPGEAGLLERHRRQVETWMRALEEPARRGASVEEALRILEEVDEETRRYLDQLGGVSPPAVEMLKHSVAGFLEALRAT